MAENDEAEPGGNGGTGEGAVGRRASLFGRGLFIFRYKASGSGRESCGRESGGEKDQGSASERGKGKTTRKCKKGKAAYTGRTKAESAERGSEEKEVV